MVGMTALISMRDDATDSPACDDASELPRDIRDMAGGMLVRHADLDKRSLVHTGDAHGAAKLQGARRRVSAGCVVAVCFRVHEVLWRPVCRHDDGRVA